MTTTERAAAGGGGKRSQAREMALQLLFQYDLNPGVSRDDITRQARVQLRDSDLERFALALYDGTLIHRADIDERLARAAENWRLSRMAVIDRNILRLGAYELLHTPETPPGVAFNEAIELARRLGSSDSPAFVNGVLDRLNRERRAEESTSPKEEVLARAPREDREAATPLTERDGGESRADSERENALESSGTPSPFGGGVAAEGSASEGAAPEDSPPVAS